MNTLSLNCKIILFLLLSLNVLSAQSPNCGSLTCNDNVRAAINPGCSGFISIDGLLEDPCYGAGVTYEMEAKLDNNKTVSASISASTAGSLGNGLEMDSDNFRCSKTYTVKITRSVNGGSRNTCVGTVSFQDNTPPVINAPVQVISICGDVSEDILREQLQYSIVDFCHNIETSIDVGNFPAYFCNGTPTIPITIEAQDLCGNRSKKSFDVQVTRPTTFFAPKDMILACGSATDPANAGYPSLDADGDGDGDIPIIGTTCSFKAEYSDLIQPNSNGTKVIRTWTVRDLCQDNAPTIFRQTIEAKDTKAPVFTCPTNRELGTINEPYIVPTTLANCKARLNLPLPNAVDDCDGAVRPTLRRIVNIYNQSDVYRSEDAELSVGKYHAEYIAEDAAGNTSLLCKIYFDVKPNSTPVAACVDQINVSFSGGSANIRAVDLDEGSTDYCGAVSFSVKKDGGDWQDAIEFTCQDAANDLKVHLRVLSSGGVENTCWATITDGYANSPCSPSTSSTDTATEEGTPVTDATNDGNDTENEQESATTETTFDINNVTRLKGAIYTPSQEPVVGATIHAKGTIEYEQSAITDVNGIFELMLPKNIGYDITPQKNADMTNGVSVLDLVVMTRHILGITSFATPYQYIAGDINGSGTITAYDVVQLRQMILDVTNPSIQNVPAWRFIEQGQQFDTANPLTTLFNENSTIDVLKEEVDIAFTAVKIGDLNGNATGNLLSSAPRRQRTKVQMNLVDRLLEKGEIVEVPIHLTNPEDLLGVQVAIQATNAEVVAVQQATDKAPYYHVKDNKITICWDQLAHQLQEADPFIKVQLKANQVGKLSDFIQISRDKGSIAAIAYNEAEEAFDIQLAFESSLSKGPTSLTLLSNSPNPFKSTTNLSFLLTESQPIQIAIFDSQGKKVWTKEYTGIKGKNTIPLNQKSIGTTGVLLYQLRTADGVFTGKMISQL